jgi:pseudouridine kinase
MSFSLTPRVCVIGGANVDIHGAAYQPLRLRDSNPGSVHVSPGGVARNVAENLSRLGVDCRLVTAVGKDPHGEMLLAHGRETGIDMRYVQELESAPRPPRRTWPCWTAAATCRLRLRTWPSWIS